MPQFIVAYDLRCPVSPHDEFLDRAEAEGWSRWIWGPKNQKWKHLPNTTLIGTFDSSTAAKAAFENAKSATEQVIGFPVTVPKYVLGTFTETSWNSDVTMDP